MAGDITAGSIGHHAGPMPAPAYLARRGTPIHPQALVEHDCLGYLFSDRMTDKIWSFSKEDETFNVPVTSRLKVNNTLGKLNAALPGFGITLCAEDVLQPYVQRGELVVLFDDFDGPAYPVSLAVRLVGPALAGKTVAEATEMQRSSRLPG
jgi:DNA-binding transcriptional LysR family regulator